MPKKIENVPGINITKATEKVRTMFFELASENILPLPDVRHFKTSQMHSAPSSFDARLSVNLEKKGRDFVFTGIISSQCGSMQYAKIEYAYR